MVINKEEDLWLFGYGSLIWKPPPHFGNKGTKHFGRRTLKVSQIYVYPGTLKDTFGVSGSEDHRGTPEAPGRVVTLIDRSHWETLTDQHSDAPLQTWGAAYRIPASHVAEVREYLDIREINGYSMQYSRFHVSKAYAASHELPAPIDCLVYIGLPDNPQFMGPQDLQTLAEHIVRSRGPSGENKDYLYELDQALKDLSEDSEDEHVHDLARRCRKVEAQATGNLEKQQDPSVIGSELRTVGSTEEQEEVEK